MDDLGNRAGSVTQRDGVYVYDVDDITNRYVSINSANIEYDAAGNLINSN